MFVAELAGATWRKSSYSGGGSNDACVEVAWLKSSYSGSGSNDNCVEVAWPSTDEPSVAVRDSKNPATGALAVPRAAWARFLGTV